MSEASAILAAKSKSFALAARLLPASCREGAAVLYAFCRRADDSIDLGAPEGAELRLAELRRELAAIYRGERQSEPLLEAFRELTVRFQIPAHLPSALLDGMQMDLGRVRFVDLDELLLYSYRVAGVVGLMMCPLLGLTDRRAERHAAQLGIAMQLTNICRDVVEDRGRDRIYLPRQMLLSAGASAGVGNGGDFDAADRPAIRRVVERLLELAQRYYRASELGLAALPFRSAFAIRTAHNVYAAIGDELARRDFDVFGGRAFVPARKKWGLMASAFVGELVLRARPFRRNAALADALPGNPHAAPLLDP
jgi:phytoene synthase